MANARLARCDENSQKLGARFVGRYWRIENMEKAGGVDKVTLKSKTGNTRLDIDQVNLPKSKMQPSTDLWPNLCASYKDGKLGVELLWPDRGPLLNFTLHNALRLNCGDAVSCCVLRRIVMPTYDDNGQFQADESFCDGRFRGKST